MKWIAALCVGSALTLAGCSSPSTPSSQQAQMKTWVNQTGFGPVVGTLENDARSATQVLASGAGVNAAHTVCAVLLLDAENANNNLPTPNQNTSMLLSKAYGDLGAAATSCYRAPKSTSAQRAFLKNRNRGLAFLVEGQATIEAALGAPISTSTTADNGSTAQ